MRKRLLHIAVVVLLAALAACGSSDAPDAPGEPPSPEAQAPDELVVVVPVEAERPERGDISAYLRLTTRVEAERQVEVTAEGTGTCVAVRAEEGDTVDRGDILAELDKSDALAQLRQSEIQARQAKADYERAKKAMEFGIIAPVELDNARFSWESAEASLELQRIQVENLTIRAPIGGVVTRRMVNLGQIVPSGSPVFRVVDPASFMLVVNPAEGELARLRVGQEALVTIDALDTEPFTARVSRINPSVDPASGTVKVQLEIPPAVRGQLRESVFANVRLVVETHEDVLLVPRDAVVEDNARDYLFLVSETNPVPEPDTGATAAPPEDALWARRVEVTVGLEDSSHAEIEQGVTEDDLVITMGQKNLKNGARIRLSSAEEEIGARQDLSVEEALDAARTRREALSERNREEAAGQEPDGRGPDEDAPDGEDAE